MVALKAQWAVYAGLLPGQDMTEHTKTWSYTSLDYDKDGGARGFRWMGMGADAHAYAGQLAARGLNHVRVEYLWL